ncbi:MAG: hypothetical protein OXU54_05275, partial [Gammaproteobacteria bacterium]|nr:hypothetical protein [Gammaproteobacteria bacterium]
DTFNLNAALTGTASGDAGADAFNLGAMGSASAGLDGGGDTDTLTGRDAAATWTLAAVGNTYVSGSLTQSFRNMEVLTGGTGVDTFDFDVADAAVTANGDSGDDILDFATLTSALTVTLDDTTIGATDMATGIAILSGFDGSVAVTGGMTVAFSGIGEMRAGGATADALRGMAANSAGTDMFTVSSAGSGAYINLGRTAFMTGTRSSQQLDFSGFESLQERNNRSGTEFDFQAFAGVEIAGDGRGLDSVMLFDSLPSSAVSAITVALSGARMAGYEGSVTAVGSSDTVAFRGINAVRTGSARPMDTLRGRDVAATWVLAMGTELSRYESADSMTPATTRTLSFRNFSSLVGGTGRDTLQGLDAVGAWTLPGTGFIYQIAEEQEVDDGMGGTMTVTTMTTVTPPALSSFEALRGGNMADTFTVSGTSPYGLEGGAGADVLDFSARTTAVEVALSGVPDADGFGGSVGSVSGGTVVGAFSGIREIRGSMTATEDELAGLGAGGVFTEDATTMFPTAYAFNSQTLTLANFERRVANAAALLNLASMSGNLIFTLTAGTASGYSVSWQVAGGTATTATGITEIRGGMGAEDRLIGLNADAEWTLAAPQASSYDTAGAPTLQIRNIEELQGGSMADTFNLGASVSMLDGGMGTDTLAGRDAAATWTLATGGTTYSSAASGMLTSLNQPFQNIENLRGGRGVDAFVFDGGSAAMVDGGSGTAFMDVLDFRRLAADVSVTLSGEPDSEGFGGSVAGGATLDFDGIFRIRGSEGALGGGNQNRLQGADYSSGAVEWELDAAGGGDYVRTAAQILRFDNFPVLAGGTGIDRFQLNSGGSAARIAGGAGADAFTFSGGSVSDGIEGGMGADIADFGSSAAALTVTLSGTPGAAGFSGAVEDMDADVVANFQGLDAILGSLSSMGDRLTGLNMDADWRWIREGSPSNVFGRYQIDDSGMTREFGFLNIDFLSGGTGTDRLDFGALTEATDAVTVTLSGAPTAAGFGGAVSGGVTVGFAGVDALTGSEVMTPPPPALPVPMDRLAGLDAVATWTLRAAGNRYQSADGDGTMRELSFRGFEHLDGGSVADAFMGDNAHAGSISGGAGADVFALDILGSATMLDGGMGRDALQGQDAVATWTLTGTSFSYTVMGGAAVTPPAVTSIEALQGGSMADTFAVTGAYAGDLMGGDGDDVFQIGTGAALTGSLLGEGGADTFDFGGGSVSGAAVGGADADVLDFADLTPAVTVTLSGTPGTAGFDGAAAGGVTLSSFTGIRTLVGGMGADSLSGLASAATWTLAASHSYASGGETLGFRGIENLQGGTGVDRFVVDAAYTGDLMGGGGADMFTLNAGGSVTGTVAGGADADVLDFASLTTAVSVALDGTPGADGFGGGVSGGAVVSAFTGIRELRGGAATTDGLAGLDAAATWTLGAANRYQSGGQALDFAAIETLSGGTGVDAFTLSEAHPGSLSGGGGTAEDVLELAPASGWAALLLTPTAQRLYSGDDTMLSADLFVQSLDGFEAFAAGADASAYAAALPDTLGANLAINTPIGMVPVAGEERLTLPVLRDFLGPVLLGGIPQVVSLGGDVTRLPLPVSDSGRVLPALPAPVPPAAAFVDDRGVGAGLLTIAGPVAVPGSLFLLGRDVALAADIAAGAVSPGDSDAQVAGSGQEVVIVAAGTQGVTTSGDIEVLLDGDLVRNVRGSGALVVAGGAVEQAASLRFYLGVMGPLRFAQGGGQGAPTINPGSVFQGVSLSVLENTYIQALNLNVVEQVLSAINPASDLLNLISLFIIDPSLFETELELFSLIGTGISMYLSQCEELEGCAPPLELSDLDALIAEVQEALAGLREELRRARAEEADASESRGLDKRLLGYEKVLQDYLKLREEFIEYFGGGEEELDEDGLEEEDFDPGDEAPLPEAGRGAPLQALLVPARGPLAR